jgi:ABC-type nitrate/sulfonate/bicarbonate transport system permease component
MSTGKFGRNLLLSWSGFLGLLILWQILSMTRLIDPTIFPGPVEVIISAFTHVSVSRMLQHAGISLFRVSMGFLLGTVTGIILGIVSGWYTRLGSILRTPIELLRPIPPLGWIPLAIIWLGLGESSKIMIISLGAFFPVFTNCHKGMMTIDPNIIRAGQTLGLDGYRLFLRVILPAALPDIAIGLRLGWSYSFGCMVAAELIAASSGLGYMIMHAREFGYVGVIVYGIILIGILNLVTDMFIQEFILKRKLRWATLNAE